MAAQAQRSGGRLIAEDALRRRLHAHFGSVRQQPGPLAALRLLRFDFGWSTFFQPASATQLAAPPLNSTALETEEGLAALAALFEGEDALVLARSCAAPMSRPMVREEAFRSTFAWLQHDSGAAAFASEHYAALEQLVLAALTDTWSAVRKASARALGRALVPLAPAELRALHDSVLELRRHLPTSAQAAAAAAEPSGGSGSGGGTLGAGWSAANAWKAHEGLLLGTTALLRFLSGHASGQLPPPSLGEPAAAPPACRTTAAERSDLFGEACVAIRPTLFVMLAHDQLTVREFAQEAFLVSLPDGGSGGACKAFAELIGRLATATSANASSANAASAVAAPPVAPALPPTSPPRDAGSSPASTSSAPPECFPSTASR